MMIVAKKAYRSSIINVSARVASRRSDTRLDQAVWSDGSADGVRVRWMWCNAAALRGALVNERIISGGVDKTFEDVAVKRPLHCAL